VLSVNAFAQSEPDDYPGLLLWMRSSDNIEVEGGEVSQWNSINDPDIFLEQPIESNRGVMSPALDELNGFQSLVLDNSEFYSLSEDVSNARTVFLLVKHSTGTSTQFEPVLGHSEFFDFHGTEGTTLFRAMSVSSGILNGDTRVNTISIPATEIDKPQEFSIISIRSTQNLRFNSLSRDRSLSRYWQGEFVELIFYSEEMDIESVEGIENYLINRYAPPVDLGPDIQTVDFCPFSISVPERYTNVTWSTGTSGQEIIIDEPGEYWVTATNVFGLESSDTINVTFPGSYVQDFTLCSDSDSLWDPGLSEFEVIWQDGSDTESFTISEEGEYYFTVTDNQDCTYQSPTVQVSIDPFPNEFEIELADPFCEGNSLIVNIEEPNFIQWSDGSSDFEILPEEEGEYSVTAENSNGCTAQDTVQVVFGGIAPLTNFESELNCETLSLELNDNTEILDGSFITEYTWLANGDEFATVSDPDYEGNSGIAEIELIVETSNGCTGIHSDSITIPGILNYEVISGLICEGDEGSIEVSISIPFDTVADFTTNLYSLEQELVSSSNTDQLIVPELTKGDYPLEIIAAGTSGCTQTAFDFVEISAGEFCFEPEASGNLLLWLDGSENVDLNDGGVVTWQDRRSNGVEAIAPAESNEPDYLQEIPKLNNRGALDFDGVNDFLDFGEISSIRTLFLVYKHDSLFNNIREVLFGHPTLFDFHGSATDSLLFSPTATSESIRNGLTRVNGIIEDPLDLTKPREFEILAINPTGELTARYITNDRNNSGRYWDGQYVEILFYSDSLSDETVNMIEQYLRYKYNPPVNLPRQIRVDYGFCDTNLVAYQPWFRSYEWSTGSTDSIISVNESGWYQVEVTDIFGYTSIDSVEVIFDGNFLLEDEILCAQDSLLYDSQLNAGDYSINWSTNENSSSIIITEEGLYSVTVIDTLGCSYTSEEIFIDVDSFPTSANLIDLPVFCLGNDLFLASGFEEAETYAWSTGEDTPFIQPQESGEYWVEATNANGCVGRDTVEVDIVGVAPDVDFGFSPPCENNEVDFNDLTVPEGGSITNWNWTFENNPAGTSDQQNPAIFYESTGIYPVELTVTLDNGCTGTGRDTIFVNPLPLVNFSAPIVCAGNEVFFESLSGVPGGGTIASRSWSFGNGTTDVGSVGSTTFEELGFNTVTHIVTTEAQCTDSLVRTVEVLGSPIADFSATDACLGDPITFTENVDVSQSGSVFYNWQFGDGFFSNFPNTSHEYANAGVYEVTLTATGNNLGVNGCTDQITKSVRVYQPPTAALSTTDACIGGVTELVDLTAPQNLAGTVDPIADRLWTITDGPTGSQQGPVGSDSLQPFIPEAAGTFTVLLELSTLAGCEASAEGSILVQAIPTAEFILELPVEAPPFTATPQNLTANGEAFEWLINGDPVSSEFEPELNFDEPGAYEVWLVATNDLQCNDTAEALFTVVIPEYDLELVDLQYQNQGNKLVLTAFINNNGNVPVQTFDTRVEVGRDIAVDIDSEFLLPAGQIREYTLGTEFGYLPGRDLPYTCMRIANPNGQQEKDTTNNYLCIGLDEQRATFAAPYPNPANDEVNLAFILPEAGQVRVEFVGPDGKLVEDFLLELEEGLNELVYPLIGWSQGLYFLKFSYRSQEEVHRLVIAR